MAPRIPKFTQRQWLTLFVFSVADFCNAICVSLQAPFYPREAENKGATATEYGLVFGIFELVVFLISPIYGKHLNVLGPKFLYNAGIYTTGTCAILFGLLDKFEEHDSFITFSFLIRIIEALGNAAFLTASFAIIAKEFPDNVATTFASLETFFGLGLIVGPTVGGALYELGGYTTPFAVLGSVLFLAAILTMIVLPQHGNEEMEAVENIGLLPALRSPSVMLSTLSIVATSISIGFLSATLEPHLRQFGLSPVLMGLMFVINGGMYAITAPMWGWLCDSHVSPKVVTGIGVLLVVCGFLLVGPASFFPVEPCLWLSILGLMIHGFGIGAQLVAGFSDALRSMILDGYKNNIETYGLVSGLWTSSFALGAFIGPSIAGFLFDAVGFRTGTLFVVATHLFVGILLLIYMCVMSGRRPYKQIESDETERLVVADERRRSSIITNGHASNGRAIFSNGNAHILDYTTGGEEDEMGRSLPSTSFVGPIAMSYRSLEANAFLQRKGSVF